MPLFNHFIYMRHWQSKHNCINRSRECTKNWVLCDVLIQPHIKPKDYPESCIICKKTRTQSSLLTCLKFHSQSRRRQSANLCLICLEALLCNQGLDYEWLPSNDPYCSPSVDILPTLSPLFQASLQLSVSMSLKQPVVLLWGRKGQGIFTCGFGGGLGVSWKRVLSSKCYVASNRQFPGGSKEMGTQIDHGRVLKILSR